MFKCSVCDVTAKTICNFRTHLSTKKHILNVENVNQNAIIVLDNSNLNINISTQIQKLKFICKCCNKELSTKYNLKRHIDTCSEVKDHLERQQLNAINELVNDIQTNNNLDQVLGGNQPINIVINNITNNTNNNLQVNVTQYKNSTDEYNDYWKLHNINPVGFENLDMLKNPEIANKIHGNGLNAFMGLVKAVYSDKTNHNMALVNQREKLVKFLNSKGEIEITTLNKMLDLLVQNNIDVLDKFLDDATIPIKQSYKTVIDRLKFIHEQDGDNPFFPKYVAALKIVLLNISKSALENMDEFENTISNDCEQMQKLKDLKIPSTELRLTTSDIF